MFFSEEYVKCSNSIDWAPLYKNFKLEGPGSDVTWSMDGNLETYKASKDNYSYRTYCMNDKLCNLFTHVQWLEWEREYGQSEIF